MWQSNPFHIVSSYSQLPPDEQVKRPFTKKNSKTKAGSVRILYFSIHFFLFFITIISIIFFIFFFN